MHVYKHTKNYFPWADPDACESEMKLYPLWLNCKEQRVFTPRRQRKKANAEGK